MAVVFEIALALLMSGDGFDGGRVAQFTSRTPASGHRTGYKDAIRTQMTIRSDPRRNLPKVPNAIDAPTLLKLQRDMNIEAGS